jgi:hypothetical protein
VPADVLKRFDWHIRKCEVQTPMKLENPGGMDYVRFGDKYVVWMSPPEHHIPNDTVRKGSSLSECCLPGSLRVCLDCGQEFDYDWNVMCRGKAVSLPSIALNPALRLEFMKDA